ncbi:bifunctional diaminohydroxyphosphoribosylaminopyrimidine deaminase/5-amino-6-(5-phosphoribosylamino)uracil reductase RibD [Corynebacterium sp.]|jgi:diaminohydroxyphosphoribosylaminopyrimidine deaminase/5-amino-6-(5-phosphoribosylamino)uracil reductase|uniref:bifunctional diaminohydroxyphosphoribosylaminopyrimidine deaminase/5-amino-6-(5-phosphoribosylamino)uracil reductase RibD n=1 Tax=Corynebacterium sp. TaxID=1720 RepID=UPI0025BFA040|nr:bifunctional diaminohydroxyphosphoribosylaminopyrimidine deaminase/5-amino-6-(5-phosphoribosylamino)uracil reductase RibD [Corynebacterium sp.]
MTEEVLVPLLTAAGSGQDEAGTLARAVLTADEAGHRVRGTTSPNPPVGAVVLDRHGAVVGVGATSPPGGAHAEVAALATAGEKARGGTAVVTLEPCNHTGRTGPCSRALVQAGVRRVVFVFADPGETAGGGATYLREHGVEVLGPLLRLSAVPPGTPVFSVEPWLVSQRLGRPHVTLKYAATLDGFAAATDGSSQWITGGQARQRVHLDRSRRDAIVVGSGTVAVDNPRLTARRPDGTLYDHQPLRVVVGVTALPEEAAVRPALHVPSRDPGTVLGELAGRGLVDVLVEGGPQLAAAFIDAGLVDAVEAYTAPALLGAGLPAVAARPGTATTMAGIHRFTLRSADTIGGDVLTVTTRSWQGS